MASRALRRRASYRAVNGHARVKSHPLLKFFLVGLVAITMVTSGASAATIFFYGQNLPTLKNFKQRFEFQNTIIRDSTGRQLYDMADLQRKGGGKRVVEPIRDPSHRTSYYRARNESWLAGWDSPGVPVDLQNATIATEDATFYSNLGFDPLSIVRAGIDNYTQGHIVSGGSTITQQLVKEYMLDPPRPLDGRRRKSSWLLNSRRNTRSSKSFSTISTACPTEIYPSGRRPQPRPTSIPASGISTLYSAHF
jgi:hypothetical protein